MSGLRALNMTCVLDRQIGLALLQTVILLQLIQTVL
jgi:hypothetical protein